MAKKKNTSEKNFIGRKLYIHWKDNMYVAIEKVAAGSKKCLEIKSHLMDKNCSAVMLCNLLEDENGNIEEEVLGAPAMENPGYAIDQIFVNKCFWMTPGEAAALDTLLKPNTQSNYKKEKNGKWTK